MNKFITNKDKQNPYVMLNKTPLSDERISWRAKGIWAYLLSKPDGWKVREQDLMNKSTEGRDAVRTAIDELVKYGYIVKNEVREKGKFCRVDYSIYETPIENPKPPKPKRKRALKPLTGNPSTAKNKTIDSPLPEKPSTVKPLTENPLHSNKGNVLSTNINNKRTTTTVIPKGITNNKPIKPVVVFSEEEDKLRTDMVDIGVDYDVATALIKDKGVEACEKQLNYCKLRKNVYDPAGWVVNAIKKAYVIKHKNIQPTQYFKAEESEPVSEEEWLARSNGDKGDPEVNAIVEAFKKKNNL